MYGVTIGSLPTGLFSDEVTGEISGTSTAGGTFEFKITAQDVNGCFGVQNLSLTILSLNIIFKNGFETAF